MVLFFASYCVAEPEEMPLDISAENGIEIFDNEQYLVARGDVAAEKGSNILFADMCEAHYKKGKKRDLEHIKADGNVILYAPDGTLYADQGDYLIPKDAMVFTGAALRICASEGRLKARDKIVYHPEAHVAEAFGEVKVFYGDKELYADYIKAHFIEEAAEKSDPKGTADVGGSLTLEHLDADGHVKLVQPGRVVYCDSATYTVQKDLTICRGHVKVVEEGKIAEGDYAEIDRQTGVSKLLSQPAQEAHHRKRVRALLVQDKEKTK